MKLKLWSALICFATLAFAGERPVWTERVIWREGSKLLATGIASRAASEEAGRRTATNNARAEIARFHAALGEPLPPVLEQMTYQEGNDATGYTFFVLLYSDLSPREEAGFRQPASAAPAIAAVPSYPPTVWDAPAPWMFGACVGLGGATTSIPMTTAVLGVTFERRFFERVGLGVSAEYLTGWGGELKSTGTGGENVRERTFTGGAFSANLPVYVWHFFAAPEIGAIFGSAVDRGAETQVTQTFVGGKVGYQISVTRAAGVNLAVEARRYSDSNGLTGATPVRGLLGAYWRF